MPLSTATQPMTAGNDESKSETQQILDALRHGYEVSRKKKQAVQAVEARRAGRDRAGLRNALDQELARRGIAREPVWVEGALDEIERSDIERAQQNKQQRTAALRDVRGFARAVRRERQAGAKGVVPAVLRALTKAGRAPDWMAVPGGSLFPRIPGADAEPRAVQLDIDAGPVLERALSDRAIVPGESSAVVDVWLSPIESSNGCVAVNIGETCVGTLDQAASNRLRGLMSSAESVGLSEPRASGTAKLARAKDFDPPFLLVIPVPPAGHAAPV